jgi:hypothetical protein
MLYGSIAGGTQAPLRGVSMTAIWIAAVVVLAGVVIGFIVSRRAVRQGRIDALGPGDIVIVCTPDRVRLLARVIARGPSHFWIELSPGDARWWVPATAVEPASKRSSRRAWFRSSSAEAPRQTLSRQ